MRIPLFFFTLRFVFSPAHRYSVYNNVKVRVVDAGLRLFTAQEKWLVHTHSLRVCVWLHVWIACCHHPLTSLRENHYHQNYHRRHLSLSTSKPLHFSLFPPHCRLCSPVTHLAVWLELILISSGMVGPFVQLKKPKSKHGQHGAACRLWRKTEIGKRCNAEMLRVSGFPLFHTCARP